MEQKSKNVKQAAAKDDKSKKQFGTDVKAAPVAAKKAKKTKKTSRGK